MTLTTTICLWNDDGAMLTMYEFFNEVYNHPWFLAFNIDQYCDRRYTTNIQRFNYDPFTGEKISWKEVRKYYDKWIEEFYPNTLNK
jgi:hypothetical protein